MKTNNKWAEPDSARPGVCHRCGWTTMVVPLSRHDRKVLRTDFRRLCEECGKALGGAEVSRPVVLMRPGSWAANPT